MSVRAIFKETYNVQNPALGAALIWRFAVGYRTKSSTSDFPALQLCFLVPPLLFHQETFDLLKGTQPRSGLHQFADKFSQSESQKADVLLALHTRAEAMRALTLSALKVGVRTGLFTVESSSGRLVPLSDTKPRGVPSTVEKMLSNAEKFGGWLADLSLFEVSSALKVGF